MTTPAPGGSPTTAPTPPANAQLPTDVPGLIDYANLHFALAQTALRDGDFARYGTEIALVEAALQRLQVLAPDSHAERRTVGQPRPMTRGVALSGGLLVTLATPATWPLALAAFLIRGGIVLARRCRSSCCRRRSASATSFGPSLTAIALGGVPAEAIVGGVVALVGLLVWLFGGGWLAAALEAEGARIVASGRGRRRAPDRTLRAVRRRGPRPGSSPSGCRHRPAPARPGVGIGPAGRGDLSRADQSDATSSTPIVVRVLRETPEVVAAIVVAWMVGEIVGAIAARRIVLAGDGVGRALVGAIRTSASGTRCRALARFWIPTIVLVLVVLPAGIGAGSAWSAAAANLGTLDDPVRAVLSVVALVFLWTRRPAARERGLRLARSRLDHRGGAPAGDVRGVPGPPTG